MASPLHLLVNPLSRHGGEKRRALVERMLRTQGHEVRTHVTTAPGDAETYVGGLSEQDRVAVVGGDGTIAEAARGAVRSGAALIPLPGGRGNDLCRYFGVHLDLPKAVLAIPTYVERRVDAGAVDGRVFLGVATIGFDSIANDNANSSRLRGQVVYAAGALRALARWKPVTFGLVVDGQPREVHGWSVVVGNTGRYGGGMRICPDAEVDDGLLDLVTIADGSKLEFLRSLPSVFDGTHVDNPRVRTERVRTVRIESIDGGNRAHRRRMAMFADGDRIADVPLEVGVLPGAVRLIVPHPRKAR
ncbi:diacylglycerol kinase family protein [Blastococcus sp. Marseille-P5729]|uniref:diacylglycerol/lipid kinase family protein n=1 Tax=Blastococcus sp. Marseille-P5729 TaxID=2086582 RepID=UPI00131E3617|nr:diacylglycerol kinase family protein [Blastococcus sp. Marseille-P5729]